MPTGLPGDAGPAMNFESADAGHPSCPHSLPDTAQSVIAYVCNVA